MFPAIELLGLLGGGINTASNLPQLLKIRREQSAVGISLTTWSLSYTITALWLAYGIRTTSPSQIITNAAYGILVLLVLVATLKYSAQSKTVGSLILLGIPAFFLPLGLSIAKPWLTLILLGFAFSRLPQLRTSWQTYRSGRTSAVSIASWFLNMLANVCWIAYGIMDARPTVIWPSAIYLLSSATIIGLELAARRVGRERRS